jgi:nicotinamide-nucleotide amidase
MQTLLLLAEKIAALLKQRGETVAVAESSTGGLISAALLAQAGASAWFIGGAVVYTRTSRAVLLGIGETDMAGMRPSTE